MIHVRTYWRSGLRLCAWAVLSLSVAGCELRVGEKAAPYHHTFKSGLKVKHPTTPYQLTAGNTELQLMGSNIKLISEESTEEEKIVEQGQRLQLSLQVYDLELNHVSGGTFYAYTHRVPQGLWNAIHGMPVTSSRRVVLPPNPGLCRSEPKEQFECRRKKPTNAEHCPIALPSTQFLGECEIDLYGGYEAEISALDFNTAYVVDISIHKACKPLWLTTCGLGGIFSSRCTAYELWCDE